MKLSRRQLLTASAAYLAGCKSDYWAKTESVKQAGTAADDSIVRAEIHPAIGIARIGNSSTDYFIGPEVVDPATTNAGASRDANGALKRQAARFRIYGYNAQNQIVRELTADTADIDWFVQLANKKAAWYRFIAALDIPDSANLVSSIRRNKAVVDRTSLVAGGGTKTIRGKSVSGATYRFDTSLFGAAFSLGEVRTDETGRLLVLGGLGNSGSPSNATIYDETDADSFNNADGWYDDTADGPVSAIVRLSGRTIPVESSWVVVAPPNYAPDVIGWRTMHDLLVDTFVDAGMLTLPATTSFTKDVLPALRRMANLQWTNEGFSEGFRRGVVNDFENPTNIAKLNDKSAANQAFRQSVQAQFRPPGTARMNWPWLYGDGYGTFENSTTDDLDVSKLRTLHLQRWADGNYTDDWDPTKTPVTTIDQVALGEQPAMLDRAALHFCLADAFHPGCEMTWPMRHASMYSAPFRIKRRQDADPEPDYGAALTPTIALGATGPLNAQAAGDITRWMALPWQGDTVFCRSGYEPAYDPYLPTFWPARVPNHVLTAEDYATAMDTTQSHDARLAAFRNRQSWTRAMVGGPPQQMLQMVATFGQMGVVEARPGPSNDPDLPSVMFVESLPPALKSLMKGTRGEGLDTIGGGPGGGPPGAANAPVRSPIARAAQSKAQQAGWQDEAQLEAFRRIRVHRKH